MSATPLPSSAILTTIIIFGAVLLGPGANAQHDAAPPTRSVAPVADEAAPTETESEFVEPDGPLTLETALALALMHNPEMEVFSWETRAAEARALQARKLPNPELDVRLYRLGIPRANTPLDEARRRVVLRQELELGGKRARRTRVARAERALAEWDYEAKRREVVATVEGEFAAVQGAQRKVRSQREAVEYLESVHEKIATAVETGAMRTFDLHESRRRLGMAKIELAAEEARFVAARSRLAATWAGGVPRFTEAAGAFESTAPLPPLDVLLAAADESPGVARWETEITRSEAALALAKAGRIPDVTLGGGVRWEDSLDGKDYLVDVEFDLPLFDRKQGDVRAGKHELARARAEREAARVAVRRFITEMWLQADERGKTARLIADEVLPSARAMFDAARVGFDSGAGKPDDVFDARRDLSRAEADLADAVVGYRRARATLESILGDVAAIGSPRR